MRLNEQEAALALKQLNNIVILTHRLPDGDTIGSAAALCLGLRQIGKEAFVLNNPQITEKYSSLLKGLTCNEIKDEMTIVAVDIAAEDMYPKGLSLKQPVTIAIDHHRANSDYAINALVRMERAACGEIIYDVLEELGVEITISIAEALYIAVSTDTGCFRYSNVNAHTFHVAAGLMAAGVAAYPINRRLFEVKRFARLQLEAYLTENIVFCANRRVGICSIPLSIKEELKLDEDDLDDIAGFARLIEGVEIAAMLREQPNGVVKISLRSSQTYDVGSICKAFGGGGHFCAAGASFSGTIDETIDSLLKKIYDYYPDLK